MAHPALGPVNCELCETREFTVFIFQKTEFKLQLYLQLKCHQWRASLVSKLVVLKCLLTATKRCGFFILSGREECLHLRAWRESWLLFTQGQILQNNLLFFSLVIALYKKESFFFHLCLIVGFEKSCNCFCITSPPVQCPLAGQAENLFLVY